MSRYEELKLDPDRDLEILTENLTDEFRTLPLKLYRYSQERAEIQQNLSLKKLDIKNLRSKRYIDLKSEDKKLTEKHIESLIDIDPEYQNLTYELISLEADLTAIDGFLNALKAKQSMLIQLGADARKE